MALSTYNELQSAIASELFDRSDSTDEIKRFIQLTETQMNRELRVHDMITRADLAIDGQFTALPSDHRETIRLYLDGEYRPLETISPDAMADHRSASLDATGVPKYLAYAGGDIEVFPTPGSSHTGKLQYYATIPALSDTTPTNWLLTKHPDAYLYGALLAAGSHFADAELTRRATAIYMAAIAGINEESMHRQYPGPMKMQIKKGRYA